MKQKTLLLLMGLFFFTLVTSAQKKMYTTTGTETIFSWASAKWNGADVNSITRFSPVFNFQSQVHMDQSEHVGLFTGLSFRNVGFIYDDPAVAKQRWKARVYSLGIPIGIKVGNMNGGFLFGGYEIEFPLNFKEKRFLNDDKQEVNNYWFGSRTPSLYHTVFAGIQTKYGAQIKFKYYLTNFFNKGFSANDGSGNIIYPYQNFDANVFYVSLSYQILKGLKFYYVEKKDASASHRSFK
jgi:hypothetical protein